MPVGSMRGEPQETDPKSMASLPAAFKASFGKTFQVKAVQVMNSLSPTISPMTSPARLTREASGDSTVVVKSREEYENLVAQSMLNEVEAEAQLLQTQTKLLDAQSELQSTLHALELARQRSFKRSSSA